MIELILLNRPEDAVSAIESDIRARAIIEFEAVEFEALVSKRKELKVEIEKLKTSLKNIAKKNQKIEQDRSHSFKAWDNFLKEVLEASAKNGIDIYDVSFKGSPIGITFAERLKNFNPSFATYSGKQMPIKKDESVLDDIRIDIFEAETKLQTAQSVIERKAQVLKEILSENL